MNFLQDEYYMIIAKLIGLGLSSLGVVYSALRWKTWMTSYNNLIENSILDGMTGLVSHKMFMERLVGEVARAKRHDEKLTLLFLDLDKFKRINDTYGHLFGDLVIKETADIIKHNVRTHDTVGRYGGEEFSVILVNTEKSDCMITVERIRKNIAEHKFQNSEINERMTISIGMAEFPTDSEDSRGLIHYADEKMYEVKKAGGNKIK